ncbi:MAG TPA: cytochrome c family protein [Verrucomicrobiae bacterium]|jgi:cytochrome c|nr:cytochrome c family protein [Verrucomicrobiae bacterium]
MLKHSVGRLALAFLLIAGAGPARAEGDVVKGEQIYHRCQGCHSIDRNRIGPMHKGLFGRPAGSVPGFDYSAAMKNSGIVWSATTLDLFLQGPRQMVPGTKMTFVGVPKAQDRADLIAYLEVATKP